MCDYVENADQLWLQDSADSVITVENTDHCDYETLYGQCVIT